MALGGDANFQRWGLVGESRKLGYYHVPGSWELHFLVTDLSLSLSLSLSLNPGCHEVNSFLHYDVVLHYRPINTQPSNHVETFKTMSQDKSFLL
jgi:hypothetical protein